MIEFWVENLSKPISGQGDIFVDDEIIHTNCATYQCIAWRAQNQASEWFQAEGILCQISVTKHI